MGIKAKYKYIQDPLYGMVYLSDVEMRIIDSEAFQRLLNVKQLGYAYAVFPGTDYSRFSHCVGTCHNMGLWIDTLKKRGNRVDPALGVLYRVAALLHDVGHYPFSHPTERAAKNYYQQLKETVPDGTNPGTIPTFYNHERIGAVIIECDDQVHDAILDAGLSFVALQRVYKRHSVDSMSCLLSSDLDADRLDYLWRTAHHSGLPYGRIDHQYLITQLLLDEEERVCWDEKALGAVDHAFIARYFDYLQITHNKTVVALELVLEALVCKMLEVGIMDLSVGFVKEQLREKTWIKIDDHFMYESIRKLHYQSSEQAIKNLCDSLLSRNPPRMLYSYSFVGSYEGIGEFERFKESCKLKLWEIADAEGIDRRFCFVWGSPFKFTNYNGGAVIEPQDRMTKKELYEIPRTTSDYKTSVPVLENPMSLTRLFYTKRKYELRVYLLFPEFKDGKENKTALARRSRLQKKIDEALEPIRLDILGREPHKRLEWHERGGDGSTLF